MRDQAAALQAAAPGGIAMAQMFEGQAWLAHLQGDEAKRAQLDAQKYQALAEVTNGLSDAADLLRQAAELDAQNAVDAATHTTTLASAGLQSLELQQQIAGTFETGGATRGQYILANIVPDLQAELVAMQAQLKVAQDEGDQKLADQIAEGIAAKSNDILQAQLDAQEAIKSNTDVLKDLAGPIGIQFQGQTETPRFASALSGG
jgi:hypothetical protein